MKIPDIFKKNTNLTVICLMLSAFTLLAFHIPFFRQVINNIESDFNGVLITGSLAILMLALNFFIYYLLLFSGRMVGKIILAVSFLGNAITLYFINSYEVLITSQMMGNVFNTQFSEASGFFSFSFILYLLLLGVPPCLYIFFRKFSYGSVKRFFANIGIALGVIIAVVAVNLKNTTWIDRNATELGSLLMPWSYTVNSVRFWNAERKRNAKAILLPDAEIADSSRQVCVLIIGESARRDRFSLYGYNRETNPLLAQDSVKTYIATAAATYTTEGVKAIIDHKATDDLYEILPNYLYRHGVDVVWRTTNWGEPPVHIEKYRKAADIKQMYPQAESEYDGILLEGLRDEIANSTKDKIFITLHTSTSHGPTYNKKYPIEFEKFTPVCNTVEMSKADPAELNNSYDNTILYTDYLIHQTIETLREFTDRSCCVLFVSDHGESLGENNLYMHGVPMSLAPREQLEIPFIVWLSSNNHKLKNLPEVGQYHVFHSILDFFGMKSPVFDETKNIFE
jgi:lipid A ethanolaminephosphotransferase